MFAVNPETLDIVMHQGDTGSFTITCEKESGAEWTADDRLVFSVKDSMGNTVLCRFYRLDAGRTSVSLDPGTVLIEFHNDDTDMWPVGQYKTEFRADISPVWSGTPSTDDCTDGLQSAAQIIEGATVRTFVQSTLTINAVNWRI